MKTVATSLDQTQLDQLEKTDIPADETPIPQPAKSAPVSEDSLAPISSDSLGGSSTDPNVYGTSATSKKSTTGGHHPVSMQLQG